MARRVLDEANADYDWIDIDKDPAAVDEVMRLNRGMRSVPTIVFPDGSVIVEPSRRELTARLAEERQKSNQGRPLSPEPLPGPAHPRVWWRRR